MNFTNIMKTLTAAAAVVAVCATPAISKTFTELKAAASPAGGAWYVGVGAMGKAISTHYPDIDVAIFPGGGLANVLHVDRGASDFGIAAHSVIVAAAQGIEPYKKPAENVMGMLNLHDSTLMHFIVNKASGITSLEQIAEKKMPIRISMSHTAGNSYLFGRWILEEYGISQKNITEWGGKIYTPSTNDAAAMMKDGQLDIALWIGPGEAFIVRDMMNSVDLDILPVSEKVIEAVHKKYGLDRGVIPASYYDGKFGHDIVTVSASTELMVNKNVPEDTVYKLVKAICESRDDIVIASPFWKSFTAKEAGTGLAVPLHPGAAKYYKEMGYIK
ncbi:TAXI family TRAP transporter solute-binding subunit [uncultured Mailhella sp.]|mgnify:FL=1|uniref:TAXI family TRAP transporter solute-binding subunit n=1 Tax=uncultured Mailhella sp. TaxID=1981031 RepID=UPI0025E344ED|nr:TAXI family TRAP transporter solute-binding subunit [uncultured Mailhella sp.]